MQISTESTFVLHEPVSPDTELDPPRPMTLPEAIGWLLVYVAFGLLFGTGMAQVLARIGEMGR